MQGLIPSSQTALAGLADYIASLLGFFMRGRKVREVSMGLATIVMQREEQRLSPEAYLDLEEMERRANSIPAHKFPSVGDTIAILHCVKRNSAGEVLGVHRADAIGVDTISAVYLDGTVRTGLGDVWEVQAAHGKSSVTKGAKWATINPMHGKGSN